MTEQKCCPKCGAPYKKFDYNSNITFACGSFIYRDNGEFHTSNQCYENQLAAKDAELAVQRRALEILRKYAEQ